MPVGLHSGRVWRNSIFCLFPSLVDIYAEPLLKIEFFKQMATVMVSNFELFDRLERLFFSAEACLTIIPTITVSVKKRRHSIYQYSNMAAMLLAQISIFTGVLFCSQVPL